MRADGSYVAVVLGNWMLSAGYIDRWWGPGWEGSLIYGSNARPIPSITIERNYSDPIDHPWFRWIGQWRLVATMGQLEEERDDAPNAQFFGMRATWKPHPRLEVGISRTAQWCGDGRPCDARHLLGPADRQRQRPAAGGAAGQPDGGFDARWSVPWAPVAIYAQAIGEDEADFLPTKYLGLAGVEVWGGLGERSWRAHIESADTPAASTRTRRSSAAHTATVIYSDGYQYYDRVIGHSIDGDSRQFAVGAMLVNGDGSSWELAVQDAQGQSQGRQSGPVRVAVSRWNRVPRPAPPPDPAWG